jgi:CRP-like cAMP-binding protein
MNRTRISLLQAMPIFGGIRDDILEFLIDRSAIVERAPGEFFFREGDAGQSVLVLETGTVSVVKGWQGEEVLLQRLRAGDCFGEMALIDLSGRSASVRADEACVAIELTADSLFRIYERDLEQFALIQMNMGRELSRRLREADERLFQGRIGKTEAIEEYVIRST